MSNESATPRTKSGLRISGATPTGITKRVASGVGREIKQAFGANGKKVTIKGLRFVPSTKIDLGHGDFQVIANSVVEVAGVKGGMSRAESVDSVVTVGREIRTGQVLRTVKIPSLEKVPA